MKKLILLSFVLSGCATDYWSDKHEMMRFREEATEAASKRISCEGSLIKLWANYTHKSETDLTDAEITIMKATCKKQYPPPKAPEMCLTAEKFNQE